MTADLFSDAQIQLWKTNLATWSTMSEAQIEMVVESARQPASDLAAALELDPMEVAANISKAVVSAIEGAT